MTASASQPEYLPPHTQRPDGSWPETAAEAILRQSGQFRADWGAAWKPDYEPPSQLPPQVDSALDFLRAGLSEIEIRLELQKMYGTSARPNQAFTKALALLVEEEKRGLDVLPERVQAIRFRAIQGAMRDRSWGAVATLLRDALPQAPVQLGDSAAELMITIEQEAEPADTAIAPEQPPEAA
jgi:hypothetical protein